MGLKDAHNPSIVWKKVLSLVGNFDLDTDRVLDLIVEARLQNAQAAHFLTLLQYFKKESVVLVIGNKLKVDIVKPSDDQPLAEKRIYCGPPDIFDGVNLQQLFKEVPFLANPRLTQLASRCIKDELFSYTDILPYLEPSDLSLKRISGKTAELTLAKVNKSFMMSMVEIDDNEQAKLFR